VRCVCCITYNGYAVIVDVRLVVELFFDFCVALVGSVTIMLDCFTRVGDEGHTLDR
jgi:hypothetical protein